MTISTISTPDTKKSQFEMDFFFREPYQYKKESCLGIVILFKAVSVIYFTFLTILSGCHHKEEIYSTGEEYFQKGTIFLKQDSLKQAIDEFIKAEYYFSAHGKTQNQLESIIKILDCYRLSNEAVKAKKLIHKALSLSYLSPNTTDSIYCKLFLNSAMIYSLAGDNDSATYFIRNVISKIPKNFKSSGNIQARALQVYGNILYIQGKYQEALDCYQEAITIQSSGSVSDPVQLAGCYYNTGLTLKRLGRIPDAVQLFTKALNLQKILSHRNASSLCDAYIGYSSTLIDLGYQIEAGNYLDSAESCVSNKGDIDINQKRLIASKRGVIFMSWGNYEKAHIYFAEAQRLTSKLVQNHQMIEDNYQYLGNCEYYRNQYDSALSLYNRCLNLKIINNSKGMADIYNGIALCFKGMKSYDSSDYYYQKAIKLRLQESPTNKSYLAHDLLNYGLLKLSSYQADEAIKLFSKALKINRSIYSSSGSDEANCLLSISKYYEQKKKINLSLDYCQQALRAISQMGTDKNCFILAQENQILSKILYLEILKQEANLFREMAIIHKPAYITYLRNSLICYEEISRVISQLMNSYQESESQIFIAKKEREIFTHGVLTALNLYSITKDKCFIERARQLAENSQASTYRASTILTKAIHWRGIPDSVIALEKKYSSNISVLSIALEKARKEGIQNKNKIENIQKDYFRYIDLKSKLIKFLENRYPEYYKIKYSEQSYTITQIQHQLKPGTTLIEYFNCDSLLVSFIISRDSFAIVQQITDKLFLKSIDLYMKEFNNNKTPDFGLNQCKGFLDCAYTIYATLVKPAIKISIGKNLIIIPDEKLSLLPFESLLTEPITKFSSFNKLPYLINDHAISYAINPFQAVFQQNLGKSSAPESLIAFAPFTSSTSTTNNRASRLYPPHQPHIFLAEGMKYF